MVIIYCLLVTLFNYFTQATDHEYKSTVNGIWDKVNSHHKISCKQDLFKWTEFKHWPVPIQN